MIAPIEKPETETFNVNDVLKCFYVLLNTVGGKMTVLKNTLDNNVPKDFMEKIRIESIKELDAYTISIPKKKKTGIIHTPNKRLVIPK